MPRRGALLVACFTLAACAGKESGGAAESAGGDVATMGGTISGSGKGFRLTMSGTSERAAAPGAPAAAGTPTATTTTMRVLDGKARIDFARGAAPGLAEGGWMLVEPDGGRMSIVDPAAKRVMVMDSLGNLAGMGGMGGMMQMTVRDTSSRVEDLGAGETILGFATRKYRITTAYTMEMSMMGRAIPMRTEQVTVAHVSDEATLREAGFSALEKSFGSTMGGMAGNEAASVIRMLTASRPKGFALMQDLESRIIRNGDTTKTRSSYRVTELARGGVEPVDFVVPADYARTDVGAQLRGAQAQANDAMKKSGVSAEQMQKAMEAMQKIRPAAKP